MLLTDLEVRHGTLQVNGIRCHYAEKGEGPAKGEGS